MNLVIDFGNTRIKTGIFEGNVLKENFSFDSKTALHSFLIERNFKNVIVSNVNEADDEIFSAIQVTEKKIKLTSNLPLPVKNLYATPATLGVDRIAAACGTLEIFSDRDCLVIDAGTCINYEFIDKQRQYHGGAISPGIHMRFEAMHKFTARLPLVPVKKEAKLIGDSTESCMQSGVLNGAVAEINGIIKEYVEIYPGLGVILCGGDASLFENRLKEPIFAASDLVLRGLNRILLHNVSN